MSVASLLLAAVAAWTLAGLSPGDAGERVFALLAAALPLAAAAGVGVRLLARVPGPSPLERSVLGTALGLGLLALGATLLGLAGLLGKTALLLLCGAGAFWGVGGLRAAVEAGSGPDLREAAAWSPSAVLWLLMLALAAGLPPHQYDSLVYHLPLPAAYLRQGDLSPVPGIIFSHFTQYAEMLFAVALAFGSDRAAQVLSAAAAILTAACAGLLARRMASPAAGAWTAFLTSSHAAVLLLGPTTYVEPWVGLWITASVAAFVLRLEAGGRGLLVLSGALAGFACGAKYYAAIAPFLMALWLVRSQGRRAGPDLALFGAAAALPVLPWLLKNLWFTGNPVFPFLYGWFPLRGVEWGEQASGYFQVLTEYGHPRGFLRELLEFPATLLRDALRFGGGMDVLGDLGWPLVLLGAPLAWWARPWDPAREGRAAPAAWAFLGFYLAGHFLLWFSTGVVLRFLAPVAGLFALGAACGALELARARGAARSALLAAAVLGTAANLQAVGFVHAVWQSAGPLFGSESSQEYLARRLGYAPCAQAAGALSQAKVLLAGEQRSYFLAHPALPATVYERNLLQKVLADSTKGAEAGEALRRQGLTHLLFVPAEAKRLAGYGLAEGLEGRVWKELLERSPTFFEGPACVLKELR